MKIGVLSDSHIPYRGKALPRFIWEAFSQVDLILHAGDIAEESVLIDLNCLAPVEAVRGNMDVEESFTRFKLPLKKIITTGNKKIGLIHGNGSSGTTMERARKAFEGEKVDCVVFGHSHRPFNEIIDGMLMFNPGSCTDPRREPRPSCGILHVGDTVTGEILYFDKKI
ncbi:MAG: metallophosphoesterase family protein [Bacillota bacterium]|nr:metallophosphoesterase family protein [Clostridia bacterium]